jgi:nitrous oxidase accessory protein NosD
MRKHMFGFIAVAVLPLFIPSSSFAAIWNVPGVYPTIQIAIDNAVPGDTVQVAAGTYTENITLKSGVIVQGVGTSVTTIQGDGSTAVVTATDVNSDTKIDGFTITGGAYGIYITLNSSLRISNNNITRNVRYGIWSEGSSPSISYNTITENGNLSGLIWGAGISVIGGSLNITNNPISANIADIRWVAGLYLYNSDATVDGNTITGHDASPFYI